MTSSALPPTDPTVLKISEEEAYLTLQRESRQRRKFMREVAEAILLMMKSGTDESNA